MPFPPEPGWRQTAVNIGAGLIAREISAPDDLRADRRFVVVAGHEAEAQVSKWTWSRGDATMPSFARYLMHMAKIRYELRCMPSPPGSRGCAGLRHAHGEVRGLVSSQPRPGPRAAMIIAGCWLARLPRCGVLALK